MAKPAARLLVIEDEVLQLRLLRRLLASLGHEVVGEATSVAAGLPLAREVEVDAAILDVNLRGESSAPIAAELRARGVPFVVITGYALDDRDPGALGAAPRLTKPFLPAELGQLLERVLGPRTEPGS